MKHLDTIRIFADHYQFWVYESSSELFDSLPDYTEESIKQGWQRTESSISFSTRAHLNDHRLDIFLCETNPLINKAERITSHPITVRSGITVFDTEDSFKCVLASSEYTLILAAYNLGEEQNHNEEELGNDHFFDKLEWERYELYICNYKTNQDCKIK